VHVERWMLRLLDAPAAVAARGWAAGVEVDVAVEIEDREIADNAGGWRLQVADGCGRLRREEASPGALRLTARGLAGWYAGTPLAVLRMAGVASGGWSDDDPRLDAAVTGPTPYMLDYF
jgi:predicted acetyltransferase